jgi:predicted XRE-type DNA-binding protein
MERTKIKFEEGSGNIFADLGFRNADALYSQAKIGFQVFELLTKQSLSDREAATLLGIQKTQVCHLMNGHFSRFRENELRGLLVRLAATE